MPKTAGLALPLSERVRKTLLELGLTDYEIRCYSSLLELGSSTASQLSRTAGVPYSKIYEVLGNLERKGWIESQRGRPTRYYPKPPVVAMEITRLQLEERLRSSEKLVLEELQPLYERREVKERPEIWIVRGEFNIIAKVKEAIEGCQKELLVALPMLKEGLLEPFIPILKSLKDRKVSIQILTTKSFPPETLDSLDRSFELKVRDQMFGGGIIVDGREVVLLLGKEDEKTVGPAIWSDHVGLAKFAREYFQYIWNDSKYLGHS